MSDNAAPQGNYSASINPSSILEKVFALENDPNTEGFNVWNITNAGQTTEPNNSGWSMLPWGTGHWNT